MSKGLLSVCEYRGEALGRVQGAGSVPSLPQEEGTSEDAAQGLLLSQHGRVCLSFTESKPWARGSGVLGPSLTAPHSQCGIGQVLAPVWTCQMGAGGRTGQLPAAHAVTH